MAELTTADKRRIDSSLKALEEAKKALSRLKTAGVDTSDKESEIANLNQRLRQFREAFFPNARPIK